jgi:hypothetical protein
MDKEIIEYYQWSLEMAEVELADAKTNIERDHWQEQVRWYEVKISSLKGG